MTPREFDEEIKRLVVCFGVNLFPKEKCRLIYGKVHDLDDVWFSKLVDNIILRNDPRIDFVEVVANEKAKRKAVQFTEDVSAAHLAMKEKMSNDGLSKALNKFGANNLMDAINNVKNMDLKPLD